MPTILRLRAYRFFFYSNERFEPAHVHVEHGKFPAKFWLSPVELARNNGFRAHEINLLAELVTIHEATFQEAWDDYFST
ncbi:DUF4160 domain-containing protein [Leucobacter sp. BZR 635]